MRSALGALREGQRALRAGEIELAIELFAVAESIQAEEMRQAESLELRRMLSPELYSGCDCEAAQ